MSLANQIRILHANFESITTELGVGFAAAIRHVVILLNKLLEKVLVVAKAFSAFMQTLFGKYKGGAGGFTFEDYGMDEAQDELDGMSDSASGIADGFADADEATKKLAKDLSVLPFDELNQLSKDIQNSTDTKKEKEPSSGTYTPNIGNFDEMMGDMFDLDFDGLESPLKKLEDYVSEWAKRIKEQFDKRNWDGLGREVAKGINDFIDYLLKIFDPTEVKEKIGYWIDAFTESFNGLIDEIDFEDIGTLIGEGIDVIISSVNRFIEGIDWKRLGEQLANGANSLVDAVPFDEIGELFANKLNMIWQTAEGFAEGFNWGNLGEKLAEGANAFIDKVDLESLANMLSHGLNGIADAVNRFAENFKWANAGRKLAKNANLLISQIDIDKIGTALGNVLNGLFTVAYNFVSNFNWKELGSMFANGINSIVRTVDFNLIASTVYTGLNGIIDSVKSFFRDLDAETAGNKIGEAFSKMLNGVHWQDLGNALAEVWNKAWSFLKEFIYNLGVNDTPRVEGLYSFNSISQNDVEKALKKGTGIGQALHDSLKGIIESVEIDDMVDSIKKLVQKIGEDISIAFGDQKLWYDIGQKIGKTIGGIFEDKKTWDAASGAIKSITDGLFALLAGAIDGLEEHKDKIRENLTEFIKGLPWDAILGTMSVILAAKIAAKIPYLIASELIKKALTSSIKDALKGVAEDKTISDAGGGAFKGIIKGAENLKEKLATVLPKAIETLKTSLKGLVELLGAEGVAGSVLGGLLLAGKAISELQDKMAGGNGILTPEGKVVDDFITQLQQMGSISEDVKAKLFELKEAWEEGKITQEEFIEQFKTTLEQAGVSAETASTQVQKIASTGYESKEAVDFLSTAVQGLSSNVDNSKSVYDALGITGEEAFNKIKSALGLLDASLGDSYGTLKNDFENAYRESGNNAVEALSAVETKWHDVGEYPAKIREAIDSSLGEGAFDTIIKGANDTGEAFNSTAIKTEDYGNKVKTVGEILQTATEYSKNYNEIANTTASSVEQLSSAVGNLQTSVETVPSAYETLGVTGEEAFNSIRESLSLVDASMGDMYGTLTNDFVNAYQESGESAVTALAAIDEKWGSIEGYPERIRSAIDERLGEGAFDALISGVNNSGEAFDSTKSKVDEYGNSVKTAGELAETATGHTDAYNEATGKSPSLIETLLPIIGGLASKFLASFGHKDQYYSTMETNIDETGKAVNDKENVVTSAIKKMADDTLSAFKSGIANFKTEAEGIPTGAASGIEEKKQEPVDMVQQMSEMMQEKFALHNGIHSPSKVYSEMAENIPLGVVEGIKNKEPDVLNALEGFVTSMTTKAETLVNNFKSALEKGGSEAVEKLVNGMQSKEDVLSQQIEKIKGIFDKFAESVSEIANSAYRQGEMITGKLAEGMDSQKDNIDRVIVEIATSLAEFTNFITSVKETIENDARGISDGLITGLGEGESEISMLLENYKSAFEELLEYLTNSAYDFENAGASIINALQSGLNSVYLQLPTIDVNWTPYTYGDGGYFELPSFSVSWNAKGGLFTDPSIIGVGEAGNEAVIPLTNRRTMGMIADAITANSSGIGLDEQSLIDAVAQGYVRAMMANQNNQQQPIINVVCKTENDEVLFRAVERGRSSVQYRNNPTVQY